MRNPFALVELSQAGIDPGQEDEPLDGIIEGCIGREIVKGIEYPVTGRVRCSHRIDCTNPGGTRALRWEERWLALVVGDRLMQAVPVRFVIDSQQVQLTGGGPVDLAAYCEAVESPELPLELRLPELPRGR